MSNWHEHIQQQRNWRQASLSSRGRRAEGSRKPACPLAHHFCPAACCLLSAAQCGGWLACSRDVAAGRPQVHVEAVVRLPVAAGEGEDAAAVVLAGAHNLLAPAARGGRGWGGAGQGR